MVYSVNLLTGWVCFLGGALSGMLIGLKFHRPEWLGGYDSLPRRMVRLGHIAFFGLGLINLLFALSVAAPSRAAGVGSSLLIVGAVTMPLNCFLTAWRGGFRHWFFVPAGSTSAAIAAVIVHLL